MQKRLTLPQPYPKLALADARRQAAEAMELVFRGIDPGAAPVAEPTVEVSVKPTFGEVAEACLSSGMKGRKGRPLSVRYVQETRRNTENHVLPAWRDRTLDAVAQRDVIALIDRVGDGPASTNPGDGRIKGRSLMRISGMTNDLPRLRGRACGTRNARPVRRQAVSARFSAPRPCM